MVTSNSVNRIIGNLFKFRPENDWNNYTQQMKFLFLANSIKDDNNKKAVLLSPCCSDTYKLFKNLIAPEDIGTSSYAEIKRLMGEHKNPKPNQIAERFKFNSRNCESNKSLSEYMAELCHLTQFCDYRTVLNMLQNRLVYGTNHNQIQQKLLSEGLSLTLERALSIAISVESAINQLSLTSQYQQQAPVSREEPTNIFRRTESKPDISCYHCNGNHKPETCPFKDKEYF